MSPKAKKYRRNITSAPSAGITNNTFNTTQPASVAPKFTGKVDANAIPIPTAQSFGRDLRWIGLTTLIVIVLMVIAYYAVPR
jgi:hypothetical protein